jgi:hypothetical protein
MRLRSLTWAVSFAAATACAAMMHADAQGNSTIQFDMQGVLRYCPNQMGEQGSPCNSPQLQHMLTVHRQSTEGAPPVSYYCLKTMEFAGGMEAHPNVKPEDGLAICYTGGLGRDELHTLCHIAMHDNDFSNLLGYDLECRCIHCNSTRRDREHSV